MERKKRREEKKREKRKEERKEKREKRREERKEKRREKKRKEKREGRREKEKREEEQERANGPPVPAHVRSILYSTIESMLSIQCAVCYCLHQIQLVPALEQHEQARIVQE